jgi:hypothetical protein
MASIHKNFFDGNFFRFSPVKQNRNRKEVNAMNKREFAIGLALIVGVIGLGRPAGAQDVISKEVAMEGSYCHTKFPAIDEDTLSSSTPSLNNSGDLIDFYGACDRNPLGNDEVLSQRLQSQHRFESEYSD